MLPGLLRDTWRLLTFRLPAEEFEQFDRRHLYFGLICCWLAGIGRFWATPYVPWYGRLGLGSLLYPFVFALPLALLLWPYVGRFQYLRVVTYVALTGPLAFLYAPLVPGWLDVPTASQLRMYALGLVSAWRVGLLVQFCTMIAGLRIGAALAVSGLLLTGIVTGVTALNLEGVVIAIMGAPRPPTPSDASYGLLTLLSIVSILLLPITAVATLITSMMTSRRRRIAATPQE